MSNNTLDIPKSRIDAGQRLQKAMNKRHLTVEALSRRTHLSTGVITKMISGERELHRDDLILLGWHLEVRPSWIAWGNRGR